jgi:alkanesulfonate monooxygenase SsuD/methylene tetrahydromethanopterin reductase-like flavin-dependent oxidoreductase (luciferase family)
MAADTQEEAARLFTSREMWRLGRDRGVYAPLPSPEEAAAQAYTEGEKLRITRLRERGLYGTAASVGERLRALAKQYDAAEAAILTTLHDPEARRHSYTLLAREFGLPGR